YDVSPSEVNDTQQIFLASLYVNDFTRGGRNYQVNAQADAPFRMNKETARQFRVRTNKGELALFGTFVEFKDSTGPLVVTRYNMFPSISVMGAPAPGFSSGDAIDVVEELAETQLPRGMGYEWTELTYLQIQAGNTAMIVFAIAVVLVFLVLAAQYE